MQHGTLEIVRARLSMETREKDEIRREMIAVKEELRSERRKYEKELEKLRLSHQSARDFLAEEKKQLLDAKQSQERVGLLRGGWLSGLGYSKRDRAAGCSARRSPLSDSHRRRKIPPASA